MITSALHKQPETLDDWNSTAEELGRTFAERASVYDRKGEFVHQNYHDLREAGFFAMVIPAELGGGGAAYGQLADTVRTLGHHCGSTALAFAMHSHPVAVNVFKHLRGDNRATAILDQTGAGAGSVTGAGAGSGAGAGTGSGAGTVPAARRSR